MIVKAICYFVVIGGSLLCVSVGVIHIIAERITRYWRTR